MLILRRNCLLLFKGVWALILSNEGTCQIGRMLKSHPIPQSVLLATKHFVILLPACWWLNKILKLTTAMPHEKKITWLPHEKEEWVITQSAQSDYLSLFISMYHFLLLWKRIKHSYGIKSHVLFLENKVRKRSQILLVFWNINFFPVFPEQKCWVMLCFYIYLYVYTQQQSWGYRLNQLSLEAHRHYLPDSETVFFSFRHDSLMAWIKELKEGLEGTEKLQFSFS